jgi:Rps23 Pro-64 3,4-dihydroxylase Tpa1-like proline 4-hydroxylase
MEEICRSPFPHMILYDFIPESLLSNVIKEYNHLLDEKKNQWVYYDNPIEHKLAYNSLECSSALQELTKYVGEPAFIQRIQSAFGLEDIELDTELYGAGLHNHPTGGFLSTHLDYEINPRTFKKRWLNLLIYLNDDWKDEYNGDTELWNADHTICEKRVYPEYNKALLFQTDDQSWHGVSRSIRCPPTTSRKTVAFYYVSKRIYDVSKDLPDESKIRWKAQFYNPDYMELCKIRSQRRLVPEDYIHIQQRDTPNA